MEMEQSTDGQTHKKGRHRKKLLYTEILNQMEFYFSDANLSKDRFLGERIKADPFVELSLFMKFNKIRKLTTNITDIAKAISKSELLDLSEDKTKVKRKLPLQIKVNVDHCTVYVERLKSDATHEWLTSIFSEFGKVVYVSIPKYRNSEIIKGFAFVEFEDEEGAQKALEYFESIHCTIPSFMEPQKLCSISTFEPEEDKNRKNKAEGNEIVKDEEEGDKNGEEGVKKDQKDGKNSAEEESEEIEKDRGKEEKRKKKRKHSNSGSDDEQKEKRKKDNSECIKKEDVSEKKRKKDDKKAKKEEKVEKDDNQDEEAECEPVQKKVKVEDANEEEKSKEDVEMKDESSEEELEGKKKKKKKHFRKKVNLKEIGLQILSKKEWKKMRNKYLDLQKKTMKELKAHFNRQRFSYNNYNKKQNGDDESSKEDKPNAEEKEAKKQFVPGLIAKLTLNEPCENNKTLKAELKSSVSGVQFIDIPHQVGSTEIHVRFSDAENAKTFSQSGFENGKVQVLEGDEEKQYWDRIATARKAKFKKHEGKQRGRDKLLKKAEKEAAKHIRFDENE